MRCDAIDVAYAIWGNITSTAVDKSSTTANIDQEDLLSAVLSVL